MKSFFISEIKATGDGKVPSFIILKPGVNIITGPSNTGKSRIFKCIDYILGAKEFPLSETHGFDTISATFETLEGHFTLVRTKSSRIIENSSVPGLDNGMITADEHKNLLLELLGIESGLKIYSSQSRTPKSLTFRGFNYISMLSETNILRPGTIFENPEKGAPLTYGYSALLYLLYGNTYVTDDKEEDKKTKKKKRDAVKTYINSKIQTLNREFMAMQNQMGDFSEDDLEDALKNIEALETRISNVTEKLQHKTSESLDLASRIEDAQMSLDRFAVLRKQYKSDLRRLDFIGDGMDKGKNLPKSNECPFCHSQIKSGVIDMPDDIEGEKNKTHHLLEGLEETVSGLKQECNKLSVEKKELDEEILHIQRGLHDVLNPQLSELRLKISQYNEWQRITSQIQSIKKMKDVFQYDLEEKEQEEKTEQEDFKPKELLKDDFFADMNALIKKWLGDDIILDRNTMDLYLDGQTKATQGKGYMAYYNSFLALLLRKYMLESAKYCPSVLVLDSPLLTLKEDIDVSELVEEGKKINLMNFLKTEFNALGQVIVIENDLPRYDYSWANVITFTKSKHDGRYGFLDGVTSK